MKKIAKSLTLMILVVALMTGVTIGATPNNWTGDTGIDLTQETTIIQNGLSSCKVSVNTGTQANCDLTNDAVSVTAGNTYTFSFYMRSSAYVKARVVLFWTGSTVVTYGDYTDISTDSFAELSYSGTVPTGATAVQVGIRFYDQTGFSAPEVQYVDNFTFESPTGTPIALANGDMENWPSVGVADPTSLLSSVI